MLSRIYLRRLNAELEKFIWLAKMFYYIGGELAGRAPSALSHATMIYSRQ